MKHLPIILKSLCVATSLCWAVSSGSAQNLVTNPGFETGNFSGYTLNEPGGFSNVGSNPAFANSGTFHANLAPAVDATGSLSQVLTTTAGTAYTLSFFLANNNSGAVNFFQAFINGALVSASTSPPFSNNGVYQQLFANFTATGSSTTLDFRYRHDPDFWRLDDVSVTRAAVATPDSGATLWLALPILAGLCLLHVRVRRGVCAAV